MISSNLCVVSNLLGVPDECYISKRFGYYKRFLLERIHLFITLNAATYGPNFVGNHEDTFQRSALCDLPPHAPAPLRPHRGRIQNIPPCPDSKRLRSSVPHHLVRSASCHRVFPQSFYVGLCMAQYILLGKHLGTIPSISPIPDDNASECNWLRRGHLQLPTICQLLRFSKSVPVTHFGDRRLPLLPLPINVNRNSQPVPWLTPLQFSLDPPDPEGEDQ